MNNTVGSIASCAAGGCGAAPTIVVPATGLYPLAIVSDTASIYWTDPSPNSVAQGILKCAVGAACAPSTVVGAPAFNIAVDGTSVYWTDAATYSVVRLTPK